MVEYKCEKCGYVFKKKCNYNYHLIRKYPCIPMKILPQTSPIKPHDCTNSGEIINNHLADENVIDNINQDHYTCQYCDKKIIRKDHYSRHLIKYCKEKQKIDQNKTIETDTLLELTNKINKLDKIVTDIQSEIHDTANTNVYNTNVTNNLTNITINVYGSEDMSHLTDDDYKIVFNKFRSCIPLFIQMKHYDRRKPTNGNIFISNIKSEHLMLYKGNKWIVANQAETIQDMYDSNCEYLIDKFETMKDHLDKITLMRFNKFIDQYEDKKLIKKSSKDIKYILYNNRDMLFR